MSGRRPQDLVSVLLVSAGTLAFEIGLTRVFSLTYWHHFAALLIALALTGFGAAGVLAALVLPRLENRRSGALAATALAAAGAMPLSYLAALAVGLEPLSLAWSARAWLDLGLVCLVLVLPFVPAAAHVCLVLAWSERPGRAYAANLAGSGLGCLAAALALSRLLPPQVIYPAVGLGLLGGLVQAGGLTRPGRVLAALSAAGLLALVLAWPLPLRFEPFKDRSAALAAQGGRLEQRSVGLRGVGEVIAGPAFHYAAGLSLICPDPLPAQKGLFLDGDLLGPITALEPERAWPGFLACLLAGLPHRVFRPERVLVIHPGGGLGLLAALAGRAGRVVALEDNPGLLELMTGPLAGFSGRIFLRPEVKVVRADPARFLARSPAAFDLIVLGQGEAWGAGSASGLGVSRLLTGEGLTRLLGALAPGGVLALSGPLQTPPRASLKLLATAAEALERLKVQPGQALALVRDWRTALLLVKPAGLSPAERDGLRSAAWSGGFDLSWLPGLGEEETNRFHRLRGEPLYAAASLIAAGRSREVLGSSWFDLRPASRDRPYFFNFFRLRTLGLILSPGAGTIPPVTEWGLLFTWGSLLATLLIAAAGIGPPLRRFKPRPPGLVCFGLLGLGYMAAEVSLLNEAIYRLGQPALAVPLVIGVFLVVSGLGSLLWGSLRPRPFALAAALVLPLALLALRRGPEGLLFTGLALAPAALVMGAPFAGGLTHLAGPSRPARAWAFGVNGFFSVAGSLAASLVCLQTGHLSAVLAASGCYLAAGWTAGRGKS